MIERRIKDLSIALEVLSRVNGYDAVRARDNVEELLAAALADAKCQLEERSMAAKTDPMDAPKPNLDDEIPF